MEQTELERVAEAILFAACEPVELERIAMAAECDPDEAEQAVRSLMDRLSYERRGIRILRLEHAYQMCSSGEMSSYVTRALETRKPPRLSSAQLETLTVIAYYQPATRAYIEQIRGVDSAYSVGALLNKHLIEECGRLNVPGRPILYRTTPDFLRTFGLESLDELPEIEKMQFGKQELPQQNVSELLGASMAKVREMVDANTVVGTPISTGDGTTLIPISKISFAMASGGSDLKPKAAASALPFGGGAGCGVKIVPVAFLVLQGERVRMLPITEPATSTADRLIEQIPELVDRINEMISQYRAEKKVDVDLA